MRPRTEVTVHLTRAQYDELRQVGPFSEGLRAALDSPDFDPLLDERVTVGHSFRRGNG
jgi:hypothetical protein